MNMKMRRIVSLILVLLGLCLFAMGMYAKRRVATVKESIHSGSSLFSDNPFNKEFGKALNEKISAYDLPILLAITGGVVCVVGGVWLFVRGRR